MFHVLSARFEVQEGAVDETQLLFSRLPLSLAGEKPSLKLVACPFSDSLHIYKHSNVFFL